MEFYQTAYQFLRRSGLSVSKGYIQNRMLSHPDYPSIVSLTDTLDEIGAQYAAVVADKDHLHELSYPILAYVNANEQGAFVEVLNPGKFSDNVFADQWEGICLYIKKGTASNYSEDREWANRKRRLHILQVSALIAVVGFLVVEIFYHLSAVGLLFQVLSLAGAVLCAQIVSYSMGKGNVLTSQLCAGSEGNGCDKVLHSKIGNWGIVSLADAGMIYFIGLSLFLASVTFSPAQFSGGLNLIRVVAGLSLLVSIGSILYQWKVAKGWCKMCLMVSGVLWIQALVVYSRQPSSLRFSFYHIAVFALSLIVPAVLWVVYKILALRIDQLILKEIDALKFRRHPKVFLSILHHERKVDCSFWEHEILLGEAGAPMKLTVVCNPYCRPCAEAHHHLEELLKLYPTKICINIRFSCRASHPSDKRTIAAASIVNSYISGNRNAVDEWFSHMDFEEFERAYPQRGDETLIGAILRRHEEWTNDARITHTPTVFMNGREMPMQYRVNDLKSMINLISENITPPAAVANAGK